MLLYRLLWHTGGWPCHYRTNGFRWLHTGCGRVCSPMWVVELGTLYVPTVVWHMLTWKVCHTAHTTAIVATVCSALVNHRLETHLYCCPHSCGGVSCIGVHWSNNS